METTTELTPEVRAMRVAVAKDVIAQLDAERVKATPGTYLWFPANLLNTETGATLDGDLQSIVDAIQPKCEVCAIGAAVLSKARLYDGVPCEKLFDSTHNAWSHSPTAGLGMGKAESVDALEGVFDRDTLDLMECAFERYLGGVRGVIRDEHRAAIGFGYGWGDPADRLRAIYENVIANDGEFVVSPVEV